MAVVRWRRTLAVGALVGFLFGWLLPTLIAPPVTSLALTLRDNPRLSDAVVGVSALGVSIAAAPAVYLTQHTTSRLLPEAVIGAVSWALIGLAAGAFVVAVRAARERPTRRRLGVAGAIGGLFLAWMVPAICQALGECFVHCWMHEGVLGEIAGLGGGALRLVGRFAELPWALLVERAPEPPRPPLAAIFSALVWAALSAAVAWTAAALRTAKRPCPAAPGAEET